MTWHLQKRSNRQGRDAPAGRPYRDLRRIPNCEQLPVRLTGAARAGTTPAVGVAVLPPMT